MRAVFLDRDGVLNRVVLRDGAPGSPRQPAELELVPDAAAAVARLRGAGFLTFVVTNQPDLARGLMSPSAHRVITERIRSAVRPHDMAACPHDDAHACPCRKPKPGMLTALASRWGVRLDASYMVGDGWKDVAAGRAAGCRTVLLRTDYNVGVGADDVAHGLGAAVDLIVGARREIQS
jgi:D-glycero-D-manno-heptose 1,7-bisphosphate phosphatase